MSSSRRKFSGAEKVRILRRHLIDHVPVSDLCDEYQLNVAVFHRWQKTFFENGAGAFERRNDGADRTLRERNKFLEAKLAHKDEVIAEIMESHVRLKKSLGET